MRLVKANQAKDEAFVKALLLGASGSGKTTCASKAPIPLIIQPSSQAVVSTRSVNQEAQICLIEDYYDYKHIIYSLKSGQHIEIDGKPAIKAILTQDPSILSGRKPEEYGEVTIQTVVIDDLEQIQKMLTEKIQGAAPQLTIQHWGFITQEFLSDLGALRSLRCNVIACGKVERVQDNDSQVWGVSLGGKQIKSLLPSLFNAVCFMYRKDPSETDPREYVCGFKLPEKYVTRHHPALDAVEDPDPAKWWEKMREWESGIGGTEMPTDSEILPSDYKPPVKLQRQRR